MLTLTSHASEHPDGIGAQLQRIGATFELSRFLGCDYSHSPIQNFGFNPGDGVGNDGRLKRDVIAEVNHLFHIQDDNSNQVFDDQKEFERLNFKFLNAARKAAKSKYQHLFRLGNPFPGFDHLRLGYSNVSSLWTRNFNSSSASLRDSFSVDLHVRRAVSPQQTRTAQNYVRYMPTGWYERILASLKDKLGPGKSLQINVHTDGTNDGKPIPLDHMDLDQGTRQLWLDNGFLNENGELEQHTEDLQAKFSHFGDVTVFRELRPDVALKKMVTSDLLIGAKSSFSFVAGLARGDEPVIFSSFWHKNPGNWLTLDQKVSQRKLNNFLDPIVKTQLEQGRQRDAQ